MARAQLSRASQDRVADSSAIAAEFSIPWCKSYTAEARESVRFSISTTTFSTSRCVDGRPLGADCVHHHCDIGCAAVGLYQGTQAVIRGDITAGHPANRGLRHHAG
jgi:ATP-binding cassette subfamily B protein